MAWRLTSIAAFLAALLFGPVGTPVFGDDDRFGIDLAAEDDAYFAGTDDWPAVEQSDVDAVITTAATTPVFAEVPPESTQPTAAPPETVSSHFGEFVLFGCASLVLLMQAGFAMLEVGFNSGKHAASNLFKNLLNVAVAGLAFFLVGFHLMFPAVPAKENIVGQIAPGIEFAFEAAEPEVDAPSEVSASPASGVQLHFFYYFSLAAVAAAIATGAVAGRMKFGPAVVCGAFVAGVIFPVVGYWTWGGGWLYDLGFYDLAGAGLVHMTGGFAGLAGALLVGPRIGRYTADGKPIAIPGHSLPLAALGVFLLLVGFYGLNTGAHYRISGTIDAATLGLVAVNTTLAASAACCLATGLSWILFGKPDLSMALSGLLGGLVAIAASGNAVSNFEAIAIGAVAGGAVVLSIILLDKLRIDDPIGAFPIHGVGGMWGLIACSLFGDFAAWGHMGGVVANPTFGNPSAQWTGLIAIAGFTFVCMLGLFGILKTAGALRVRPEEEERGLDVSEHGLSAYAA